MANKKMCKNYRHGHEKMGRGCCLVPTSICPANTRPDCSIVPREPAKVKAVKAWYCKVCRNASEARNGVCEKDMIPCTITYRVDGKRGVK